MKFISNYQNPGDSTSSFVTQYLAPKEETDGLDYAICRLQHNLGAGCYMGVGSNSNDATYYDYRWNSIGYRSPPSFETNQMEEKQMRINDMNVDENGGRSIKTWAFSSEGWTAGPLYDPSSSYAIAVVTKNTDELPEQTFPKHTFAAGGEPLGRLAIYGRNKVDWTQGESQTQAKDKRIWR